MQVPTQAIFYKDWANSHIPEILEEIYLKEIYKPFLFGKKDLTIVDLGANIGLASYYFSQFGKVYAVEPAKDTLELLRQMVEFNKLDVTVCPYAISNKTGKVKFYHQANTTANSLSLASNSQDFEEVETLTFEDFMIRNKLTSIDFLKLDVEGEEGKVITSDGFKKHLPKVIIGEWHDWGNMEKNQFATTLNDLGYQFNWIPGMKASVFTAVL